VIDNNISNAIKYATPNTTITISLTKEQTDIVLVFKSYGKKIQDPQRVFQKSYREDESKRGLGLGLNMVKNICEKYAVTYHLEYLSGENIFTYIFKG
jgi:signal transduction histidine kinase